MSSQNPGKPGDPAPAPNAPAEPVPLRLAATPAETARTAVPVWDLIAADPAFAELKAAKRRFIIPATVFFLVYYMTLPVLVGFFPETMKQPAWGKVNWAYLFALSQFIMTWVLCALYVRAARRWDVMNAALLARHARP
jgi:uncharacterized membrane protein (DUF485 family)